MEDTRPLSGAVALVAGATRGAGRGIARMLGEAGATVYCTGRSARGALATEGRPETIEETAEMVAAAGGEGIAVRVDHSEPSQVDDLVARIRSESGRLDVVVNDIWGGDALIDFTKPFWEHSLEDGLTAMRRGIETHVITSRYAIPLLLESGRGLIVEITDGDTYTWRYNLYYDLVKTSVIRLAFATAREVGRHGVAAVAVTPGFLRSEAMLDHFGVREANWRDGALVDPNFIASETPCYVGRAVAALAADPNVLEKSGRVFSSWRLAREYGFSDIDGRRPMWDEHVERTYGRPLRICDDGFYEYWLDDPFEQMYAAHVERERRAGG
jgi:NAD(P)-dependent dehydrogenase (short-subunit alcohol dehydrogenase family)